MKSMKNVLCGAAARTTDWPWPQAEPEAWAEAADDRRRSALKKRTATMLAYRRAPLLRAQQEKADEACERCVCAWGDSCCCWEEGGGRAV